MSFPPLIFPSRCHSLGCDFMCVYVCLVENGVKWKLSVSVKGMCDQWKSQWFVSPLSVWYYYVVDDHYARASKMFFKMEMQLFIFVLHCINMCWLAFYINRMCVVCMRSLGSWRSVNHVADREIRDYHLFWSDVSVWRDHAFVATLCRINWHEQILR